MSDKTIEFLHLMKKDLTPEQKHKRIMEYTKPLFKGKKLTLKKIDPEKSWGKEHCEYCFREFDENEEAYSDENEKYWLCKDCFVKHKKGLELEN